MYRIHLLLTLLVVTVLIFKLSTLLSLLVVRKGRTARLPLLVTLIGWTAMLPCGLQHSTARLPTSGLQHRASWLLLSCSDHVSWLTPTRCINVPALLLLRLVLLHTILTSEIASYVLDIILT